MSIQITRGIKVRPQKVVIYGPEGVGKTTLASDFPSPVFIDAEGGTDHMDVPRIEVQDMKGVRAALAHIKANQGEFKTVVLDTIDWIEKRLVKDVCAQYGKDSIEKIEGGYGKGYNILSEQFLAFLDGDLEGMLKAGFNVVLLAHAKVEKHEDPELAVSYDRYTLKMEKKTAPLVKEWADALLFYRFKAATAEREGTGKHRGISRGREIATSRTAAFDAKNRHGLPERIEIPANDTNPGAKLDAIFKMTVAPTKMESAPVVATEPDDDDIPGIPSVSEADKLAALVAEAGGQEALDAYLAESGKAWDKDLQDKAMKNKSAFVAKVQEYRKETV
jgi:hypothetical protein